MIYNHTYVWSWRRYWSHMASLGVRFNKCCLFQSRYQGNYHQSCSCFLNFCQYPRGSWDLWRVLMILVALLQDPVFLAQV